MYHIKIWSGLLVTGGLLFGAPTMAEDMPRLYERQDLLDRLQQNDSGVTGSYLASAETALLYFIRGKEWQTGRNLYRQWLGSEFAVEPDMPPYPATRFRRLARTAYMLDLLEWPDLAAAFHDRAKTMAVKADQNISNREQTAMLAAIALRYDFRDLANAWQQHNLRLEKASWSTASLEATLKALRINDRRMLHQGKAIPWLEDLPLWQGRAFEQVFPNQ